MPCGTTSFTSLKTRHVGGRPLADVGNQVAPRQQFPIAGTPDTLHKTTANHMYRGRTRSPTARSAVPTVSGAAPVPFPTISEETDSDEVPTESFIYDSAAEVTRGKEWAEEIARRQENIKELRDRKIRLEQTQASRTSRTRKSNSRSSSASLSYLTSPDRKLSADDVDFLSALHASVVWRLWHADLTSDVFASERLLATRLHLVLMRYGRQNIPVPPIVAVNRSHHMMQTFATRHMIEKDRKDIQTLPQLVAKSLLRQSQKKPRNRSSLKSVARFGGRRGAEDVRLPSPLSKETVSLM